jgi:hypothetical protein
MVNKTGRPIEKTVVGRIELASITITQHPYYHALASHSCNLGKGRGGIVGKGVWVRPRSDGANPGRV